MKEKNKDKFVYSKKSGNLNTITNDNLDCKDCKFVDKTNIATCEKFINLKPGKVLYGGKCDEKEFR